MSIEKRPPSLAERMCAVMAELKTIPKRGRNEFHKYDYATESDVADAIRPLLSKHGIAIFPSILSIEERSVNTAKGTAVATRIELQLSFIAGYEHFVSRWYGVAVDTGDKGLYKAYTGAFKYALLKTFCCSSGDTDPEQDSHEVSPNGKETKASPAPPSVPTTSTSSSSSRKTITDKQQKFLYATAREVGTTMSDVVALSRKMFGKIPLYLSNKEFTELIEKIRKGNNEPTPEEDEFGQVGLSPEEEEAGEIRLDDDGIGDF